MAPPLVYNRRRLANATTRAHMGGATSEGDYFRMAQRNGMRAKRRVSQDGMVESQLAPAGRMMGYETNRPVLDSSRLNAGEFSVQVPTSRTLPQRPRGVNLDAVNRAGQDLRQTVMESDQALRTQTNSLNTAFGSQARNRQMQSGIPRTGARTRLLEEDQQARTLANTQYVRGPIGVERERTRGVLGAAEFGYQGDVRGAEADEFAATENRRGLMGSTRLRTGADQAIEASRAQSARDVAEFGYRGDVRQAKATENVAQTNRDRGAKGQFVTETQDVYDADGNKVGQNLVTVDTATGEIVNTQEPGLPSLQRNTLAGDIEEISQGDDRYGFLNLRSRRKRIASQLGLPESYDVTAVTQAQVLKDVKSGKITREQAIQIAQMREWE